MDLRKVPFRPSLLAPVAALALSLLPFVSLARAGKTAGHVRAELAAEDARAAAGGTAWVGVWLRMDPGWHTYWKNPGDSGMATRARWTLPPGVSAGEIRWPVPTRIALPPLVSFGYEGETLLLVPLAVPAGARGTLDLTARVDWLECSDVCVPGRADLRLRLPVGPSARPDPARAALFARARARLPRALDGWAVDARRQGDRTRVSLRPPPGFAVPPGPYDVFPEDNDTAEPGTPLTVRNEGGGLRVDFPVGPAERLRAVLSTGGEPAALALDVPAPPAPKAPPLPWVLALAFAGGLLLNLMPCVLPVLSIKAFGLLKDAALPAADRRRQGAWYVLGVVVSFWVLAGALLVLRAGGHGLGWGFHLQSPRFVAALTVLFALLAGNLWGLFEIGGAWVGAAAERSRGGGAFGSGVLATVVATPCTAPFMGTAVGVALSQPAPVALGIFTSLGLGMAFPFWLLTAAPGLGRFLPRPGAWMDRVKIVLGALLAGTAFWLWAVLARQRPEAAGPVALLAAAAVAVAASGVRSRRALWAASAAALAAIGLWAWIATGRGPSGAAASIGPWESYVPERVAALEAEGRPYFIDFTAAWCLTCQVNKKTTLDRPETLALFRDRGVVLLRADWTRRDETIAAALAAHGRSGVPLYVLRGRGGPVLLPALLTPGIVRDALDKLSTEEAS